MKQFSLPVRHYWRVSSPYHSEIALYGSEWKRLVREGALFVYPTETVYGIGCDPFNEESIEKIYKAKGRPESRPLLLIACDVQAARKAFSTWPGSAEALAKQFWPGPLTILLPASPLIPGSVHAGTGKVAVRVSPHPIARFLAEAAEGLFISTSANLSDNPPISSPSQLNESMIEFIDVIIDAGVLNSSTPSTIVDCSEEPPRLIREGIIPYSEIVNSAGNSL